VSERKRVAPFVVLGVAVVMIGLVVVLLGGDDKGTPRVTAMAKPAPAAESITLDGTPFQLSRRKGSWVVLNFFNSTCVPCRAEHPELVRFHEQQRDLGLAGAELYTVMFDNDSDEAVRGFFDEFGGDWPIVRDPDGAIGVAFGVFQVPETWVIDPDGVIRLRFVSQITADELSVAIQRLRVELGR
jgi:cytochrome c biogenesis protein CcmG, thiol:disulfide interchange protein DsbE